MTRMFANKSTLAIQDLRIPFVVDAMNFALKLCSSKQGLGLFELGIVINLFLKFRKHSWWTMVDLMVGHRKLVQAVL